MISYKQIYDMMVICNAFLRIGLKIEIYLVTFMNFKELTLLSLNY